MVKEQRKRDLKPRLY